MPQKQACQQQLKTIIQILVVNIKSSTHHDQSGCTFNFTGANINCPLQLFAAKSQNVVTEQEKDP